MKKVTNVGVCGLCGEPMPPGEEMFAYHGYSGGCPKSRPAQETMDFGKALNAVKAGAKASRAGWNGKGMFIFLVPGSRFEVSRPPLLGIYPAGTMVDYHGHIDMRTADGSIVPWLASQTDLLADDWMIEAVLL